MEQLLVDETNQREMMNKTIESLTASSRQHYKITPICVDTNLAERQLKIMKKIEQIMEIIANDIKNLKNPVIQLRQQSKWTECTFVDETVKNLTTSKLHTIKFGSHGSINKFSLICFILGKIYKLITTKEVCTKREFYYQNEKVLPSADALTRAFNDISVLLDAPLSDLNIVCCSKGIIYGRIILKIHQDQIDCSSCYGTNIPNNSFDISNIESNAKFVLLVEKDAIFQKFVEDGLISKLPECILITGRGMPDINTRILLRKIWDCLSIPILALVDPNPWGIEIMCTYRFGSLSQAHQTDNVTVPCIRWLGVFPSELELLCNKTVTLNNLDKKKIKSLLIRPYVTNTAAIKDELQIMLDKGYKAEIEDIEFAYGFLSNKYIPYKIAKAKYK